MRHARSAFALATAVCAFCVAAAPAFAHQFVASLPGKTISATEPAKTVGRKEGPEEFVFGGLKIHCEKARGTGLVTEPVSQQFATSVKFGECSTEAKFGSFIGFIKTTFNEKKPVTFVYHVNGFAEVGTEVEGTNSEVKVSGGSASFTIAQNVCKIVWPAQTVPGKAVTSPEEEFSKVLYTNESVATEKLVKFPSGFQKKLLISNEFNKMEWFFEEGQCEAAEKTEGKDGHYNGALLQEVKEGNLSFE